MLFYYSVWFIISFFSIFFTQKTENRVIFFLFLLFLFLMTGARYEISGDWNNYIIIYQVFHGADFSTALLISDPGYAILNYIGQKLEFKDTFFVYMCCSFLFYSFFYFFSKRVKNYWIPLLIAFPYLILVVSMGYVRQSVAISFVLLAVLYGLERKIWKLMLFSILAMLFHKSAIIVFMLFPFFMIPQVFINNFIFIIYTFFSFLIMSILVYVSSVSGENIYTNQSGEISSAGAVFRIIVHFLPLFFYIFYRLKIKKIFKDNYRIFDYLALLIIFTLMLAIPFSTLADRFNLYLIMFDIFILSFLYSELKVFNRTFMVVSIVFFNTFMLVIWLNFGAWSQAWLPYQNYLFNYLMESV